MTQQELLSLFSIATSVGPTDKFLLHTSNGQAVEVTGELVKAYLATELNLTLVNGNIYLNGENTGVQIKDTELWQQFSALKNQIDGRSTLTVNGVEYDILAGGTIVINSGQGGTIPADIEERIQALEDANNPTSLQVSISPSGLQKKGTTKDVTVTWTLKRKDGTVVSIDSSKVNGTQRTSPAKFLNVTSTTTYQVTASVGTKSYTASVTITFVCPIYVGFDSASEAADIDFSHLTEQALRSSLGTLTPNISSNTSPNNYLWICSPYRVSKVTSDGFGADMTAAQTLSKDGSTYYCYRSLAKQASGNFNLQIS